MQNPNEPIPMKSGASASHTGYAEWIALGALAAGAVGAIVGMTTCRHGVARGRQMAEVVDPATMTAPHGDKLRGAVV